MIFAPTILVGPSGVGKGSVLAQLCVAHPDVWLSVSVTTRTPRPGEVEGRSYFFCSDAQFDALIASGGLLEWACVHGTARYGTPREAVETKIAEGRAVIMELDIQGCRQVKSTLAGVRTAFLAPPSWDVLVSRLEGRHTETEEVIARRLDTARMEMAAQSEFDTVIINDEVEKAVADLVEFIGLGSSRTCTRKKD